MNLGKEEEIIVAMSGGIDSSVAAFLLKKEGFKVTGIFMKLWTENKNEAKYSEKSAQKVAKFLKIPFYVINLSKEFREKIVSYFLEKQKEGLTPNPCVICNKEIKFGVFFKKLFKLNKKNFFVATGHYAQKIKDPKTNLFKLCRAKDKQRDQSYFLWTLNQKKLKKILFPIGNLTRKEVEKIAKKNKLPLLKIKKSVEICFIKKNVNNFLKKYLKEKPGKIVDKEGKILGTHKGLWFYTIGQRKGILLAGGPYYVLDKDSKKNNLIVTKNKKDLFKKELIAKNVNWISGKEPKLPLKIKAKIRYKSNLSPAIISKIKDRIYKVQFLTPQRAITPGQSVVFYKRDEILGGGIIY